LKSAATNTDR